MVRAALLNVLLIALGLALARAATQSQSPVSRVEPRPEAGAEIFTDRSAAVGLDFVHQNGMTGELDFPEMTGQGGALFDLDNDGDLDLYLVQGAPLRPQGGGVPPDRVYRNELDRSTATLRFLDVTAEVTAGNESDYGMGVATGDYDNDGAIDLYVTNFGPNRLLRNDGGRLRDVTAAAGAGDDRWSTSASFFDYDRDGWLDLYVVNYVEYSLEKNPRCYAASSRRDYCTPAAFVPAPDRLLHNRRDGTFEAVPLHPAGEGAHGPGLGVVSADFDGDGWLDVFVANDGAANFLWLNLHDRRFRDDALLAGAAFDRGGLPQAGMGVDAGDFDADGDEDVFLTHLTGETNTLYVNLGDGLFEDRSFESGLGPPSVPFTGFGTSFLDYDNDGWLDLFVANGAVTIQESLARRGDPYPLGHPNHLYRNLGGERFELVGPQAGASLALLEVSRGAAFGDVDDDGDTDVLLLNNRGPARLLINNAGQSRAWLGLRLLDAAGRDALGARAALERAGRPTLWRRAKTDGSYTSASDPRILFGLGDAIEEAYAASVHWPDARSERFGGLRPQTYTTLRQGTGVSVIAGSEAQP